MKPVDRHGSSSNQHFSSDLLFHTIKIYSRHNNNCQVTGLLDSGSTVNLITKELYESLPPDSVSPIQQAKNLILRLANGDDVTILGTTSLSILTTTGKHFVHCYILPQASYPLILGTEYLVNHKVILDFSSLSVYNKNVNLACSVATTVPPRTELIIKCKLRKKVPAGTTGLCTGHNALKTKGLLGAKVLATRQVNNIIPYLVCNVSDHPVTIRKNEILASFKPTGNDCKIHPFSCNVENFEKLNVDQNDASFQAFAQKNFDLDSFKSISLEQKTQLQKLLYSNRDVFVTQDNAKLGLSSQAEHVIKLKPDAKPKHIRPYRLNPDKREVLRHHLNELLEQGIIAPVSPNENVVISSPIILVEKRKQPNLKAMSKEESLNCFRFVVDYRYLNSQILDFHYQIPDIQELTESISERKPKFFTTLDLSSGFFQVGLSKESSILTAFNTCFGTYRFNRMPQGLKTSTSTFQMLIDRVFSDMTFKQVYVYIDDLIIVSETFSEHMKSLNEVFGRLRAANLKLSSKKCKFAQSKCNFLGHEVSSQGVGLPKERLDAIKDYPVPKTIRQLQRFLGLMNWFSKFIPNFSAVASPLYALTRKNRRFQWSENCQNAFEKLKHLLLTSNLLAFPRHDLQFRIQVDTSKHGIGYMLYQITPESEAMGLSQRQRLRVIRFGSKSLNRHQSSYGPTKLELLGLVTAVLQCSSYIKGSNRPTVVECDHQALKPLFSKRFTGAIYERWLSILQSFSLTIEYIPGSQAVVADALSRSRANINALTDDVYDSSMEENGAFFPYVEEKINKITLPDGQNLKDLLLSRQTEDSNENISDTNVTKLLCQTTLLQPLAEKENQPFSSFETFNKFSVLSDCEIYDADEEDEANNDLIIQCSALTRKKIKPRKKANRNKKEMKPHNANSKSDNNQKSTTRSFDKSLNISDSDRNTEVTDHGNDPSSSKNVNVNCSDSYAPIVNHSHACDNDNFDVFYDANDNFDNAHVFSDDTEIYYDSTEYVHESKRSDDDVTETNVSSGVNMTIDQLLKNINEFKSSDFSAKSVSSMQCNDPELKPIIDYLKNNILPDSQKLARKILLKSSDYMYVNDLLYHTSKPTFKRHNLTLPDYQLVLPAVMQLSVIDFYHSSPLAAHAGISATYDKIKANYYFERMSVIISDFVKTCHKCQSRKITTHTKEHITAFAKPNKPFQVYQCDIYGPLPVTPNGNAYVFTAVCMFSKYLYAVPLKTKDAITVSEAIFNMFTTFGMADCIVSDLGTEMTANITKHVSEMLGVNQQFTPAFAHHCLGGVERTHRTIAERLTPFVNSHKDNWDNFLNSVIFSINSSVHASLGFTPYEIVFGCRPCFPLSTPHKAEKLDSVPSDCHSYVKELDARLNLIREQVRENNSKSQARMCQDKNTNVRSLQIAEGDFVYLKTDTTGKGSKLHNSYEGPFLVHRTLSPHTVGLKDPTGLKKFPHPVHLNRLKLAHIRSNNPIMNLKGDDGRLSHQSKSNESDSADLNFKPTPPRRSSRLRAVTNNYTDKSILDFMLSSDDSSVYKIKHILGCNTSGAVPYYLVHLQGEPSHKSQWVTKDQLDHKARKHVEEFPPKLLNG